MVIPLLPAYLAFWFPLVTAEELNLTQFRQKLQEVPNIYHKLLILYMILTVMSTICDKDILWLLLVYYVNDIGESVCLIEYYEILCIRSMLSVVYSVKTFMTTPAPACYRCIIIMSHEAALSVRL